MRFSKTYFIIYLMLLNLTLSSQGGFRKRINLPGSYGTYALASFEISTGNYLVISKTQKMQGNSSILTFDFTKYNSTSNSYTTSQLGDTNGNFSGYSNFLHIRNIGKKINNSIYLANFIRNNNQSSYTEGLLLKLNLYGDTIWKRKYSSNNEHLFLFQSNKCKDGGLILTGCIWNVPMDISQLLLIKTDSNGLELWRKKYNNPSPNYAEGRDVIEDSATKNILITGIRLKAFSNGAQIEQKFVMLCDSLGNLKYDLPNNYNLSDPVVGLIKDLNNNYYIYGNKNKSYISGHYTNKSYITKFKVVGNSLQIILDEEFGKESVGNHFTSLMLNKNGNLEALGMIDTNILNNIQANVMIQKYKINTSGNVISNKIYNYNFNENWQFGVNSWGASLTDDGGIIAPFQRLMNNTNNYAPLFFVKYDSLGCDTSAFYCATVGIKENSYKTADVSIYPQPANQTINLSSPLFGNKSAQIQISNNLGQLCFKQNVKFNNGAVQIPLGDLPKGIYIIKLIDEDLKTFTQKLIVE